jgi:hypothetical protein
MRAHLDLQGAAPSGVMMPIHWATFNLATHPWAEPGEGTVAAAREAGARIALPRPGEPFEPTAEAVPSEPWWRGVALAPRGGWPVAGETVRDTPRDRAAGTAVDSGEPESVPTG